MKLRIALLLLIAVLPHVAMLGHDFVWDDAVQIYENRAVSEGAAFSAYFFDRSTTSSRPDYNTRIYRPLRNLTFRAIARAFGTKPFAFGVVSLGLYVACVLLLWRAVAEILRVLGVVDEARREGIAFLCAALWAAMPVHTEPVQYASAIGDLLSAAAALASLWLVARALLSTARRDFWSYLLVAAVLALCSMLSKEMSVTLVGIVAMLLWPQRKRRMDCAIVLSVFGAITLGYLALRTSVVGQLGQDAVTSETFRRGLIEAPWLVIEYARISLMPLGHSVAYVVDYPSAGGAALVAAALLITAIVLLRAGALVMLFGLGWFVLTLVPVLHLVPLWADLADRFVLFASAGLALWVAAVVWHVGSSSPRAHRIALATSVVVVLIFTAANLIEGRAWQSDAALWRFAVDREPRSGIAHENLGLIYGKENRHDEALGELDAAERLGRNGIDLHRWRAMIFDILGRKAEAEAAARRALRIDPRDRPARKVLCDALAARGAPPDPTLCP